MDGRKATGASTCSSVFTVDSGPVIDDDDGGGNEGSTYGSHTNDSATNSWPWCVVAWDGATVVGDLFASPLTRVGTDEDDWARKIGHKLLSKWADNNAMGLIVAEVLV